MRAKLLELFMTMGLKAGEAVLAASVSTVFAMFIFCVLGVFLTQKAVISLMEKVIKKSKHKWNDKLLAHRVFHRLSYLVPAIIVSFFVKEFPNQADLLNRCVSAYSILVIMFVLDALISAVEDIYREYEVSKIRPIKGFLQVVKIVLFVVGGIILIATLSGQSPMVLLGGISALTAVFMLIFQNAILGFVAGIQLTSNDMVRIGDWIEMPKYNADGTVLEISLCTVKVQNFDNTVTSIPANALTSDSFRNWRGMQDSGGRRIMRSLYLDVNSIRFCTAEMLERFSHIEYLQDYIQSRKAEIDAYNKERHISTSEPVNGRRMTNIGVFRVYIYNYLRSHPAIRQDMTLLVRQLEPQEKGIALQLYAFANTTNWEVYEGIQSDIFDHLMAVAPEFGLHIFQNPSGHDFSALLSLKRTD